MTIASELSEADHYGFIPIGIGRSVQVIQIKVRTDEEEEDVLIANTFPEPFSQALGESLMESLCQSVAKKTIGFFVAEGEGWAHIKTSGHECNAFSLAAAAAVYKVGCGWDESPSFAIKVNDAELSVSPRFDGNHWVVTSLP